MALILLRLHMPVENNHIEGTLSQYFDLGLSSYLCEKTGRFVSFFHTYFSTFHKTKTRTNINNLRHSI